MESGLDQRDGATRAPRDIRKRFLLSVVPPRSALALKCSLLRLARARLSREDRLARAEDELDLVRVERLALHQRVREARERAAAVCDDPRRVAVALASASAAAARARNARASGDSSSSATREGRREPSAHPHVSLLLAHVLARSSVLGAPRRAAARPHARRARARRRRSCGRGRRSRSAPRASRSRTRRARRTGPPAARVWSPPAGRSPRRARRPRPRRRRTRPRPRDPRA